MQTNINPKKPFYKRWWFIAIIVVVLFILIPSSDNDKIETVDKELTTPNQEIEAIEQRFGVGDSVELKDLQITLLDTEIKKETEFLAPADGKIFVGAKFEIQNISDEDISVSSLLLFDSYIDDVKDAFSSSALVAFNDGTLDGTIEPGKKLVGWYAVEAPETAQTFEISILNNWLSSHKAKFIINL